MSGAPALVPAPLAPPGGLADAFLRGEGTARELFPPTAWEPAPPTASPGASRLPGEAFHASGPGARERLARILEGDGVFVTAGHQPVLFLGPLYVLYKLLSAVEVARRLERLTGRPALALFWIASDDHDWQEVGATRVIDTRNELREVRLLPPSGAERRSVGIAPVPDGIADLIDDVAKYLPGSPLTDTYITLLRDTYRPGLTLAEGFAGLLGGVADGVRFAWLDSASPEVKRAAVPLLERALREAEALERGLEEGARRIRGAGYDPPIHLEPGATTVFLDTGTMRERIRWKEGAEDPGSRPPREEILAALAESPERFSPNVALRPVLESWLLPVGATVLGPGEIAYWSQLHDLFRSLDTPFPPVRPRLSWLVLEQKIGKVLEKSGAEPSELADGGRAVAERHLHQARPEAVSEALRALRASLGHEMDRVEEAIGAHLSGIRSAAGKAKSQLFQAVGDLEKRIDSRIREDQEVLRGQIRKAALHLYPGGKPQERVASPLYFLARYGASFLKELARRGAEATPPLWPDAPPRE
ncbi:MAG: bacillithiol biosynthesis cysteine-adding enzyme BshC [Gemmatimonadota bacterium]